MSTVREDDDRTLRELAGAVDVQLLHRRLEALTTLSTEELQALKAEVGGEIERRAPEPPAPPLEEIDGWRMAEMAPSPTRGLWDIEVTDGEHVLCFESCSDGGTLSPLEWAVEQVRAMDARSFAVNCRRCPEEGEPTRPSAWDEELIDELEESD